MGFTPAKIEAALHNIGSEGTIEDAIQWIESHETEDKATAESGPEEQPPQLSEEERQAKLKELQRRAQERRAENERKQAEENRKNEMIRKKRDVEYIKIAEQQQQQQAMKEAEKRRRQAREDAEAKRRIKAQIEADRKERLAKQTKQSQSSTLASSNTSPQAAVSPKPTAPQRDYTTSKIRFRVPNQPAPIVKEYPTDTKLATVVEDISKDIAASPSSVQFMTTFPTKTFTSADYDLTLKDAGLINTNVMVKLI